MIYKNLNMTYLDPAEFCHNNDVFIGCNISQLLINTKICEGFTGLTFTDCQLWQASVPADAIIVDCAGYQPDRTQVQWDNCYWENPNLPLPKEPEECRHVTGSLNIDGVTTLIRSNKFIVGGV